MYFWEKSGNTGAIKSWMLGYCSPVFYFEGTDQRSSMQLNVFVFLDMRMIFFLFCTDLNPPSERALNSSKGFRFLIFMNCSPCFIYSDEVNEACVKHSSVKCGPESDRCWQRGQSDSSDAPNYFSIKWNQLDLLLRLFVLIFSSSLLSSASSPLITSEVADRQHQPAGGIGYPALRWLQVNEFCREAYNECGQVCASLCPSLL